MAAMGSWLQVEGSLHSPACKGFCFSVLGGMLVFHVSDLQMMVDQAMWLSG
jgi:hypothetical protein